MTQVEIEYIGDVGEYLHGVEKMAQLLVKRQIGQGDYVDEGNALIKKYGLRQADVIERFVKLLEEA